MKPQVICDLLGISGGDDMLKCFEDAMTNSNGNRSTGNQNGFEVFDMLHM